MSLKKANIIQSDKDMSFEVSNEDTILHFNVEDDQQRQKWVSALEAAKNEELKTENDKMEEYQCYHDVAVQKHPTSQINAIPSGKDCIGGNNNHDNENSVATNEFDIVLDYSMRLASSRYKMKDSGVEVEVEVSGVDVEAEISGVEVEVLSREDGKENSAARKDTAMQQFCEKRKLKDYESLEFKRKK